MMKKQHKSAKFALTALAFSLFATPTMAKDITISQEPLLGVSKITPSVVMALSVEYPTAGVAYSTTQSLSLNAIKEGAERFDGYFDNTKCYTYIQTIAHGKPGGYRSGGTDNPEYLDRQYGTNRSEANFNGSGGYVEYGDGYFKVSSDAQNIGGYQGLCGGELEWSGNMMNFMTMSAVDIMRKTLTGGNRAKGVGASEQVYKDGDTASKTYLRRANQWGLMSDSPFDNKAAGGKDQQQYDFTRRGFDWDVYGKKVNGTPLLKYLLPHNYYDYMVRMGTSGPLAKEPGAGVGVADEGWGSFSASNQCKFGGLAAIAFMNNGTGFNIGFLQRSGSNSLYNGNIFSAGTSLTGSYINPGQRVYCGIPYTAQTESGARASSKWFNVVVERDDKPTGLLQEYASTQGMRVAAMGYLSETENTKGTHDGGVLRAKMNSVSSELNADGTFKINPEGDSAGNSGAINYINKFGDRAPYDINDPVSELYYSAIRYLRNGAWQWKTDGTQEKVSGNPNPYPYATVTDYEKDGFPVIQTWDDPFVVAGDRPEDKQCYSPAVIVLGDTNTHNDNNLPNYPGASVTDNVALDKDGTTHYYQKVCQLSGFCSGADGWRVSSGSNTTGQDYAVTFGLAGMAYWTKTNDVRPDIVRDNGKPTHIQSFFIDVLEGGLLKTKGSLWTTTKATEDSAMQNSYYLAGKFASPDYDSKKTYTRNDFDSTKNTRPLWTDDPIGETSNESFPLGMPRNYSVANNPKNMKESLVSAFKTIGFTENTLQSAIQYNNAQGAELNVTSSGTGSAALISEGAIVANKDTSGKVTGYTVKDHAKVLKRLKDTPELVPLTFHAGYNTKTWTGYLKAHILIDPTLDTDTYGSPFMEAELWNAGQILFNQYHNNSTYSSRNVQSKADNTAPTKGFMAFNAMNAASFSGNITGKVFESDENFYASLNASAKTPANLINYLLGDSSKENTTDGLRVREESLMGTSVYSSVTPILRNSVDKEVKGVPIDGGKTCKYSTVRSGDYVATASNEGMLHIFDMDGNEKYAYVPQTALPYIANYANPKYTHRYVNDGHSMLHEVCDGTNAATYLVGTSGRGASSIYAINVTNDNFKAVLEVNNQNESDIGLLVSAPIVANQAAGSTGAPVMIFSSGYNNPSGKGYLFIYNLKTGAQIAKVELGESGVGSPVGYDSNNDGIIDRVYVGDYEGKLWRVDMQEPTGDNATWDKHKPAQLVFQAEGPILNRPAIGKVGNKTAILLGTGTYLTFNDMLADTQNYGYGIFDDGSVSTTIKPNELHVQTFTSSYRTGENGMENYTFYEITHNPIPDDAKGWRLILPKGFTVTSDSAFYGPQNQLATYTATKIDDVGNKQCNVTGETLFIAVDARNGGAYESAVFDVNNDRKFDNNDALPNGYYPSAVGTDDVGLDMNVGYTNNKSSNLILGSNMNLNIVKFPTGALKTRRVSWREIF